VNSFRAAASVVPTFLRGVMPRRWMQAIEEHPLLASILPLVQQSAIYLIGAALIGLGNFVLVPLYTRYLSAEEFGVYALVEISLFMAVTTTQLGLGTTYVRWYAETEAERRGELLGSCGAAGLVAAVAGGGLLVALAGPSGLRWFAALQQLRWMLLPVVAFRNLQGLLFCALQAAQRPTAYVTAAVARLVFLSGSGIWFVVLDRRGIVGVLESWLVGDAVCFVVLLGFCAPGQRLKVRFSVLRPMLWYGAPLVWSAFMALLLDAAGRFFLANDKSLAEVALYVVGIKITNIISMGYLQPFASAWGGMVFPIAHRPNAPLTYTKMLGYALILLMLLVAVMILFGPFLVVLFAGRAYLGAVRLLPWLLLPVAFRLFEYWSSLPLYLTYKTQWIGALATAGVLSCAGLNAVLVPRLGALGAALAWAGALGVNIALMTLVSRRYYVLPVDGKTLGFAASLWLMAVAGSRITMGLTPALGLGLAVVMAAFLVAACGWYFRRDVRATKLLFTEEAYAD
jgi:O-antigen/teichoic acid export membrane protein